MLGGRQQPCRGGRISREIAAVALLGAATCVVWAAILPHRYLIAQALVEAAGSGDAGTVASMLADGADPNAGGWAGLKPLQMAAYEGRVDVIRVLLRHGADPQAGVCPAIVRHWPAVLEELRRHGATIGEEERRCTGTLVRPGERERDRAVRDILARHILRRVPSANTSDPKAPNTGGGARL